MDEPFNLLCSKCLTPGPVSDAHVIPGWNPAVSRILTTYRCGNCWLESLAETRAAVESGDAAVRSSFCDFLTHHRFTQDSARLRTESPEIQQRDLLAVLDAIEDGRLVLDP